MNPAIELLRALVRGDDAAIERYLNIRDEAWGEYADTVGAVFYLASRRRFPSKDRGEVITWVADLRSRVYDPGDAETTDLDPAATERLIWSAVSNDADLASTIAGDTVADIELKAGPELLRQLYPGDADLDAFFRDAQALAEQWKSMD